MIFCLQNVSGVFGRREFLRDSKESYNKSADFERARYIPEFTSDCRYIGAVEQFFEERTDNLIAFSTSTVLWALGLFFSFTVFFQSKSNVYIQKPLHMSCSFKVL